MSCLKFVFALCFLIACGSPPPEGTRVEVELNGVSSSARTLFVQPFVNRTSTPLLPFSIDDDARRLGRARLGLTLREDETAHLRISVAATDIHGCLIAVGESLQEVAVEPQARLTVTLAAVSLTTCEKPSEDSLPIVISSAGDAPAQTLQSGTITLTGFGFRPEDRVLLNGVDAPEWRWLTPLSISYRIPAMPGQAGMLHVSIVARGTEHPLEGLSLQRSFSELSFAPAVPIAATNAGLARYSVERVAAVDLNRDGQLDLWATGLRAEHQYLLTWISVAPRTYEKRITTLPVKGAAVTAADLNQDGVIDLLVAGNDVMTGVPTVAVALGNANMTLSEFTTFPLDMTATPTPVVHDVTAVQVVGDARPDIVVAVQAQGGRGGWVRVLQNITEDGPPRFVMNEGYSISDTVSYFSKAMAAGDLDGDGRAEVSLTNLGGGFRVHPNLPAKGDPALGRFGTLETETYYASDAAENAITMIDIDRDGRRDVIGLYSTGVAKPIQLTFLKNLCVGGVFQLSSHAVVKIEDSPGAPQTALATFALADLTGDGAPELIISGDGWNQAKLLLNQGDGTFGAPASLYFEGGVTPQRVRNAMIADLDGDGRKELIILNRDEGHPLIFWNQSS